MIVFGDVKFSENREKAFGMGAVIVVLPGDRVRRFWEGRGDGLDFMLADVEAQDGTRFLLGRVRLHLDHKLHGSDDRKEVFQFAAPPSFPQEDWDKLVPLVHGVARAAGVERIDPVATDDCGPEGLKALMDRLKAVSPGWKVGFEARDPGKEGFKR